MIDAIDTSHPQERKLAIDTVSMVKRPSAVGPSVFDAGAASSVPARASTTAGEGLPVPPSPPSAQATEAGQDAPFGTPSVSAQPVNLKLFESIQVQAQVVLGHVSLSIGELTQLETGALVPTDRLVSQPVDLIVNGIVVARGELVAVEEHFGLRITQVAQSGGA